MFASLMGDSAFGNIPAPRYKRPVRMGNAATDGVAITATDPFSELDGYAGNTGTVGSPAPSGTQTPSLAQQAANNPMNSGASSSQGPSGLSASNLPNYDGTTSNPNLPWGSIISGSVSVIDTITGAVGAADAAASNAAAQQALAAQPVIIQPTTFLGFPLAYWLVGGAAYLLLFKK